MVERTNAFVSSHSAAARSGSTACRRCAASILMAIKHQRVSQAVVHLARQPVPLAQRRQLDLVSMGPLELLMRLLKLIVRFPQLGDQTIALNPLPHDRHETVDNGLPWTRGTARRHPSASPRRS